MVAAAVVATRLVGSQALEALGVINLAITGSALVLWNSAKSHQIRESEQQFSTLVQNASDIILVVEPNGVIRYASPSTQQILGYAPSELMGRPLGELVHADDAERARIIFEEAVEQHRREFSWETRIRHVDGTWRHMEARANNLIGEPNVRGIVINSREIS